MIMLKCVSLSWLTLIQFMVVKQLRKKDNKKITEKVKLPVLRAKLQLTIRMQLKKLQKLEKSST